MSGFPTRPQLSDFGPIVLQDARPVRDPDIELAAAQWNLMKHQVAGMGLLSPRVVAQLTVDASPALAVNREAWNPRQLTSGNFAPPTPAAVATGRVTLTYLTPVEDQLGNEIPIAFAWGFGFAHASPPTTFRSVQVTPVTGQLNRLEICVFDAAGALQNGSTVWVFAG